MLLNKRKACITSLLAASLFAASWGTHAAASSASATINITGKLIATTCTPSWSTNSVMVDLGIAGVDAGDAKGTVFLTQPVGMTLSGCDAKLTKVNVTYMGNADTTDTDAFANTTVGVDAAAGAAIKLRNGGTVIKPNDSVEYTIGSGSADLNLTAELVQTDDKANVKAGDITSTVTAQFSYQ